MDEKDAGGDTSEQLFGHTGFEVTNILDAIFSTLQQERALAFLAAYAPIGQKSFPLQIAQESRTIRPFTSVHRPIASMIHADTMERT